MVFPRRFNGFENVFGCRFRFDPLYIERRFGAFSKNDRKCLSTSSFDHHLFGSDDIQYIGKALSCLRVGIHFHDDCSKTSMHRSRGSGGAAETTSSAFNTFRLSIAVNALPISKGNTSGATRSLSESSKFRQILWWQRLACKQNVGFQAAGDTCKRPRRCTCGGRSIPKSTDMGVARYLLGLPPGESNRPLNRRQAVERMKYNGKECR